VQDRVSPPSNGVTAVPSLVGLTVAEARTVLTQRGFAAELADPTALEGDVVVRQTPATPALATVGSALTLVTASGEGHAAFRMQVQNSLRIALGLRTFNVRVALTEPALVSARLFSQKRFVRTKPGRLLAWENLYTPRRVELGATIVPFPLPTTLTRPGQYVLVVTARSISSGAVTHLRTQIMVARPAVQEIAVGQRRLDVPVALGRRSVVTVQLVSTSKRAPWRKTWSNHTLEAGKTILSLPLPRSLKTPGAYRLIVEARAVGARKVTRTTLPLTVVRKHSGSRKPVDVVLVTGDELTGDTPLDPNHGVRINPAEDPDEAFAMASTPSANVQVIVVDVGGTQDVELIHALRLVYPDLKIIAVVPQGLGAAARDAGATIVVVKPAPPALISSLINRLATGG
jgi:hypothetical protein